MAKVTHRRRNFMIGGLSYFLLFLGAKEEIGGHDSDDICGGKQRWEVKVLRDTGASHINTTPKETTISHLLSINTEGQNNKFKDKGPRLEIEKQVYRVKNCFITDIIKEDDNDYHIVIEDGKGNFMVAEVPDPDCPEAGQSDWSEDFTRARQTLVANGNNFRHFRFTITGVLFRDKSHTITGKAPNKVELHPVLSIKRQNSINPIEQ